MTPVVMSDLRTVAPWLHARKAADEHWLRSSSECLLDGRDGAVEVEPAVADEVGGGDGRCAVLGGDTVDVHRSAPLNGIMDRVCRIREHELEVGIVLEVAVDQQPG